MKTDFEGMDEVGDALDGDMILERIKRDGYESLNMEDKNKIFMDKQLSDRVREYLEEERDRKIEEEVYMNFGVTKEEMGKKIDDARKIMELMDRINAKLIESGVLTVKTKVNDERGRKPSRKLVKNLVKIFANNGGKMTKDDITYKLRDIGYTAEPITLNLYVNWAINWGILNNVSGEFVINKNAVKELYGL